MNYKQKEYTSNQRTPTHRAAGERGTGWGVGERGTGRGVFFRTLFRSGFPVGWGIRRGAPRPLRSPLRGCLIVLALILQADGKWVLLVDGVYTA